MAMIQTIFWYPTRFAREPSNTIPGVPYWTRNAPPYVYMKVYRFVRHKNKEQETKRGENFLLEGIHGGVFGTPSCRRVQGVKHLSACAVTRLCMISGVFYYPACTQRMSASGVASYTTTRESTITCPLYKPYASVCLRSS